MARLITKSLDEGDDAIIDAVGPETFTFEQLVRLIGQAVKRRVRLVHLPAYIAYLATMVTGWFVGDVVLTWDEYRGLMSNLLVTQGPATGETRLSEWLTGNARHLGLQYASEVARHY